MKLLNTLAGSMFALSLVAAPFAFAQDMKKMDTQKMDMKKMDMKKMDMKKMDMNEFMKSCDMDHDGMMSKAEMVKHMEKMFDMMDTKKTGKLTRDQSAEFLKQLTTTGG